MKYDMTEIRHLEPTFLPLARNGRSYVCPVCGSGTGKNGSGMTSRDGEYWKCWSCGQSYSKVELFKIKYSLSSYDEACKGLFKYYGLTPRVVGEDETARSVVWLSRDEMDAMGLYQGPMQINGEDGQTETHGVTELFNEDPEAYYNMMISRADEMIRKYAIILQSCGDRKSPHASMVYDWLGEKFDDSSYGKIRQELERKTDMCQKVRKVYAWRLRALKQEQTENNAAMH